MPDDRESRTEPPTARRRSEARSKGQVARSPDLSAAVLLLTGLLALRFLGVDLAGQLLSATRFFLGGQAGPTLRSSDAVALAPLALRVVAQIVVPFLVIVALLALVVSWAQVGWLFTWDPLRPSLGKLNPINGLKRMISGRTFIQLIMNLAKLGVVIIVVALSLAEMLPQVLAAMRVGYEAVLVLAADVSYALGLRLAIVLLVLALADFAYRRWQHEQDLKMTKQEVKDELRQMEGDPLVKRRRREVQIQQSLQRIKSAVPSADVVVTNPTEFAVAIQYDPQQMNAPKVVAKGQDLLAQRIREVALEAGVPIVQRPPLARALFRTVEVGQEIPEQFYKAVAEILAYVYELSSGTGRSRPAYVPQ